MLQCRTEEMKCGKHLGQDGCQISFKDKSTVLSSCISCHLPFNPMWESPKYFILRNSVNDETSQTNSPLVFIKEMLLGVVPVAFLLDCPKTLLLPEDFSILSELTPQMLYAKAVVSLPDSRKCAAFTSLYYRSHCKVTACATATCHQTLCSWGQIPPSPSGIFPQSKQILAATLMPDRHMAVTERTDEKIQISSIKKKKFYILNAKIFSGNTSV